MMYRLCTLLVLISQSCHATYWYGHEYWNNRYGSEGINYPKWKGFWNGKIGYEHGYRRLGLPWYQNDCRNPTPCNRCATSKLECSGNPKVL